MPKDYPRSDRISQQIKKELAEILSLEIKDPALKKISIIDVEVAHDLKNAKVFYVADHDDEEIIKGLKRSLPFFRSLLAKRMSTRGIPKLHFEYDKTID
ncbi:30S ribosome-binding factor RbfA, partial [Methylophilaceae bacterium]|nr:30S ribosome-binding factor RbfA [Methylophilaceae bacterium]